MRMRFYLFLSFLFFRFSPFDEICYFVQLNKIIFKMIKTKSSSKRKLFSRLTKRFSRPAIFRKRDRKAPLPSETFQSSSLNSKRQSRSSLRSVFFRNSSRSISFDRRTQRKSFHFEETPENSTPKCFVSQTESFYRKSDEKSCFSFSFSANRIDKKDSIDSFRKFSSGVELRRTISVGRCFLLRSDQLEVRRTKKKSVFSIENSFSFFFSARRTKRERSERRVRISHLLLEIKPDFSIKFHFQTFLT